jgi:steroid delta-isomerase-like uncharacterized protein
MSAQDNEALMRKLHALYDAGDIGGCAALAAPDLEWLVAPFGETYRGPDGFRDGLQIWNTAFPDAKAPITYVMATGDAVAAEYDYRGIQTGPLAAPGGAIPPTGKRLDTKGCHVAQVRDGKFVSIRTYFDVATLLQQLGLMPAPAEATASSA